MIVEPIGVVTLVAGLLCLIAGLPFATFALLISTLFGASAALILPAFGNANVQPAHLLLVFFVATALTRGIGPKALIRVALYPRPGFWLALTVLYGAVSAYYFPRLFWGMTEVFGLRTDSGGNVVLTPLAPTSGNITQTVYLFGDLACFLLLCAYASSGAAAKRVLGQAVLACGAANLCFAFLDLVTYASHTTELMSPIRNATYRLLDDVETVGLKRIVGSFSEASAFGFATLGLFAFAIRLWLEGVYERAAALVAIASLIALTFSTSTTAYVGTAIFLVLTVLWSLGKMIAGRANTQIVAFVLTIPVVIGVITLVVLLNTPLRLYLEDAINTVFVTKLSSSSGIERSAWNAQALTNFFDTYGVGGGVGSLRASSFVIAVLGSIGVAGLVLYGVFILGVLVPLGPAPAKQLRLSVALQRAARSACLALLIAASLTGALVDLGLQFFALAALACAKPDLKAVAQRWLGAPAGGLAQSWSGLSPGPATQRGTRVGETVARSSAGTPSTSARAFK